MKAVHILAGAALAALLAGPALAGPRGEAGPYRVELQTEPAVIPVGRVRMLIRLTDSAGKPVEGAQINTLVKMPSMDMGEKEAVARAEPGQPGVYTAPAVFAMEGPYTAKLDISGPLGAATMNIPLSTGQNTAVVETGWTIGRLLPWILLLALVLFTLYRMRVTGQRVNWRGAAKPGIIASLLLMAAGLAFAWYAVQNLRRPGAMTPIEAQAMQMNTPAPPGVAPVSLVTVEEGPVEATVRYTGQAVGYNEQDISARVQGWLTWMPFYVGDRVKAGQVLARLDTSQIQPQIAERQAEIAMREQAVRVAREEYRKSLAEVSEAHGELGMLQGAVEEARANLTAAREERSSADAMAAAAKEKVEDAQASLAAMEADLQYWRQEIARSKQLLDRGAISKSEYQKDAAMAAGAEARARQGRAMVSQAEAELRAAQAGVRKADAMIAAAEKKIASARAELSSHAAHVRSAQAAADAARQRIRQEEASVRQARAGYSAAATQRGYAEIKALSDGVVTQRLISPGTLVNPGQAILRVAQVDPIRLQANVADADLARIRIGAPVQVSTRDGDDRPAAARVTSITPSLDPVARTGIVEAVVANPQTRFRPGQFVTMQITTARRESALRIPALALQTRPAPSGGVLTTETRSYVWVADPVPGRANEYTVEEAPVRVGARSATHVEILEGLKRGQQVVVAGHQFLRTGDTVAVVQPARSAEAPPAAGGPVRIQISSAGYTPPSITVKAGEPIKLIFTRVDERNCGDVLVFPEYGIRKELPLNQPVEVELTPKRGEIHFTCGMSMLQGKVVAQ